VLRLAELLTVVIPCKDDESYIGKLLEELDNQRGSKGMRVIVADGGSTDRTPGAIKARQLTCKNIMICVAKCSGGDDRGRNEGLKATTTPYIAFIDADMRFVYKNTLIEGIEELQNGFLMVGAPIKNYKTFNLIHKYYIKRKTFCSSSFCLVNTEKMKEIGGFDENVKNPDFTFSRNIPVGSFKLLKHQVKRIKGKDRENPTWTLLKNLIFR
jgi:glycosyltransferase involved in cell wall biosynthesis